MRKLPETIHPPTPFKGGQRQVPAFSPPLKGAQGDDIIKSKIALLSICFLLLSALPAFTFLSTYQTKANFLGVDKFGNFYSGGGNSVLKFNQEGKFVSRYEEFRYGKVGMIDVSNPMKILVFYPDFMTVVIVDRFLAELSTYKFFDLGFQNISAVASSTDGRIWFYDNIKFTLKKIDESGKVFRESQPLNLITSSAPNPNFIIEKDNVVYVNDSALGILVFDVFGNYSKTIPLKGLKRFQVLQDQIIYYDNDKLNAYNQVTFETKSLTLPDTADVRFAAIERDRLGLLKSDRVDFYSYP